MFVRTSRNLLRDAQRQTDSSHELSITVIYVLNQHKNEILSTFEFFSIVQPKFHKTEQALPVMIC